MFSEQKEMSPFFWSVKTDSGHKGPLMLLELIHSFSILTHSQQLLQNPPGSWDLLPKTRR
jgi:hypothetical protein